MYEYKIIDESDKKTFEEKLAKATNEKGYKLRDFLVVDLGGCTHYVALLEKYTEVYRYD